MLLQQTILVKWSSTNRKHFETFGYIWTNYNDEIEVSINHLQPTSGRTIEVECDYCNKKLQKTYLSYINGHKKINTDCCRLCQPIKNKEITRLEFGVDNIFQLEDIKNKSKETLLNKYGVDNYNKTEESKVRRKNTMLKLYNVEYYSQTNQWKDTIKRNNQDKIGVDWQFQAQYFKDFMVETSIRKYGVSYILQADEVRKKGIETNLKKYGTEYYTQTDECKEKFKQTCLDHFGVTSPLKNIEIMSKVRATLYTNGNCPTSTQQLSIYNILKYNNYIVELNYPLSRINLDIAVFVGDIKIDLEYDCYHWHKNQQKDRKRDEFTKSQGWKILRIKSSHKIPTLEQLVEAIDKLVKTDRTFTQIILDDWGKDYSDLKGMNRECTTI